MLERLNAAYPLEPVVQRVPTHDGERRAVAVGALDGGDLGFDQWLGGGLVHAARLDGDHAAQGQAHLLEDVPVGVQPGQLEHVGQPELDVDHDPQQLGLGELGDRTPVDLEHRHHHALVEEQLALGDLLTGRHEALPSSLGAGR